MCTLIFWHRVFDEIPLLVAANRDEQIERPSAPPAIRRIANRSVLCPTDLQAGGTWLGLNGRRLFAAVTNRYGWARDATRNTRGNLVLSALEHHNAEAAALAIAALDPRRENAFHLAIVDGDSAHLIVCDGAAISHTPLRPGLHVITERSFGAAPTRRESFIHSRLDSLAQPPDEALLSALLSTHQQDSFEGLCVHLGAYGTRSSTILRIDSEIRFRFADGPPHETPYVSVSTRELQ